MSTVLQYFQNVNRSEMTYEITQTAYATPLLKDMPCIFYYEGFDECKALMIGPPLRLADLIFANLETFKDRDWNAVVTFDERGFTHVFFGKNEGVIQMPEFISAGIAGSC